MLDGWHTNCAQEVLFCYYSVTAIGCVVSAVNGPNKYLTVANLDIRVPGVKIPLSQSALQSLNPASSSRVARDELPRRATMCR
ncbi:hypothetical protein E2C01_042126 [Portunus trituberculatus]|uniref:Uncharacterized protein n=1 Tax=Portunus trituberculatus TaxID=210409 RepID=A0A5B7FS68_PORTR|nr:hypothetical protein [Portunus trituberculatus]